MMDKKQLIAWIESLPDDLQVQPFELREGHQDHGNWHMVNGEVGVFDSTVYQKTVRTEVVLRVNFTGQVKADFKRDQFGHEQWANFRRA